MARGKSICKMLLDSSQAALFAGIEIHNKPHFDFRYPTATLLIINAWELALKAYIYKYIGKRALFERNGKHTKNFSTVLKLSYDHIITQEKNKSFKAVFENLNTLVDYRNSYAHFIEGKLDAVLFMLISKAVLNYDAFLKKYFKKDITKDDNLIIMPIGMKLPFDLIDYLKQDYGKAQNDFVNEVIMTIRELYKSGIQESIVVGFNVFADRVRNAKNADIIAALDNSSDAVPFGKAYRITDNPDAPEVRIVPDFPPLDYYDLRKRVKEKKPSIKFAKTYNAAMKIIKANPKLCKSNYLDPKNKNGNKNDFYSEEAVDILIAEYEKLENQSKK